MSQVTDQIRALLEQLDGAQSPNGPKQPAATGSYAQMQWSDNGVLLADFWVMGLIGAQRGALRQAFVQAITIEPLLGVGADTAHLYIVKPNTPDLGSALTSPADIGWMDGSGYTYSASKTAYENTSAWMKAGRPTFTQNALYDVRGEPMTPKQAAPSNEPPGTPSPADYSVGGKYYNPPLNGGQS